MLKLNLEDTMVSWLLSFKGTLSLPVTIIHCVAYIKNNNITLEQLQESQLRDSQERGMIYDRTKGFTLPRKD